MNTWRGAGASLSSFSFPFGNLLGFEVFSTGLGFCPNHLVASAFAHLDGSFEGLSTPISNLLLELCFLTLE